MEASLPRTSSALALIRIRVLVPFPIGDIWIEHLPAVQTLNGRDAFLPDRDAYRRPREAARARVFGLGHQFCHHVSRFPRDLLKPDEFSHG